jgi:hypothetical protein
VPEKPFTYVVDGAGEEHTTWQRGDVQRVAMAKQPQSRAIHGKPKISIDKEYADMFLALLVAHNKQ